MMGLVDSDDRLVAKMHGYVRDDGTLGGRGFLDPTLLVIDGVCMRMLPKPPTAFESASPETDPS